MVVTQPVDRRALDHGNPAILGLQNGDAIGKSRLEFGLEKGTLAEAADENHGGDIVTHHGDLFLHETDDVLCDGSKYALLHITARDGEAVVVEAEGVVDPNGEGVAVFREFFFVLSEVSFLVSILHILFLFFLFILSFLFFTLFVLFSF